MLFEYKYRERYRLSGEQFRQETDDDRWLMQTIWALLDERGNLNKGSGNTDN